MGSLQANFELETLQKIDKLTLLVLKRAMGMSEKDSPHVVLLPAKAFGMGFTLCHKAYTVALGRELKVLLNSSSMYRRTARARLVSLVKRMAAGKPQSRNHIGDTVRYLARYGWPIRDVGSPMTNYLLETSRGGNSANGNVSPPGERVRLHDRVHVGWAQTYAGGSAEKEQISEEDGDNWGARWRTVVPQQMRKQWAQARKE